VTDPLTGRFTESYVDTDPATLSARYQTDGYLFFRGVLDAAEVIRVRDDFIDVLRRIGALTPSSSEPEWSGMPLDEIDDEQLYRLTSYQRLCESPITRGVLERVFGEPVYVYKSTTIRYATPNAATYTTPPHQDHFFVGPNADFRTFWIPLMDIPPEVGGLCIARASHNAGLRRHVEDGEAKSYVLKGRRQMGVPMETIQDEWLTTHYRLGDVLIFHSHTIHRALPNRSGLVRLSIDARAQPASTPRSLQAQTTLLEQRKHRTEVEALAKEEGADREEFEAIVLRMLTNGADADRETVRSILSELREGTAASL
jgi:1-deoxypentalenic acid 11beta-hydroxylase